jgi:hypothetical protein
LDWSTGFFKVKSQKSKVESEPKYIEVLQQDLILFWCDFMTLPEHPLVQEITTPEYQDKINEYILVFCQR